MDEVSEATNVERVSVKERWDWFACVLQQHCAMSEEEADDLLQEFTDAVIEQECADRRAEQEAGDGDVFDGIRKAIERYLCTTWLDPYDDEKWLVEAMVEAGRRAIRIPESTEET